MATMIRPQISERNKYYIDKHRYYELKHFCLQYRSWKKAYDDACDLYLTSTIFDGLPSSYNPSDLTAKYAVRKAQYSEKMKIVEDAAKEADDYLWEYILKAVTEDLSYTYLKTKLSIPCGRDMYYDRYRKFFWILSNSRK